MDIKTLGHYIDGQWTGADEALESRNPSNTDDIVARFPDGSDDDVARAVAAAKQAQPGWANASPELRSDVLHKAGEALFARSAEIGELLAREEGKTRAEGLGETLRAARIFRYFAGEALRRHGQTLESTRPGLDVATYREALGVVGLITPWNFPIAIPAWKAAPALAFGNTVVLKPANITSAVAAALTEVLDEAGVPAGVFNLVLGRGDVGRAIVDHPDVAAISFTGSQGVGSQVAQATVARQARVQLEMGGKNPLVVLADADLDKAVAIAADGGFFQTGQRCTASSRVIVEDAIHDRFVAALVERAKGLKVGSALAEGTQVGPASSESQFEQNLSYVDIATGEGGRLAAGGGKIELDTPGFFMQPTVIADTNPEMRINCEEVFGPVVSTVRVKNYEEALAVANMGDFGLSSGIVSNDAAKIRDFRKNVRAGMVMVNLPTAGVDYHVPFGGTRGSSYGPREQGFAAVEFYTQIKTVYTGD
ncbi:aldehyde dehydrogenase family protein [Croceibacterium aestuarii]|uniref:aldehyde dehydrogenase family protein n=1 Tax=Croceibacterium aestuarii TaxID=3064139 RepID=UPI00272DFF3A|nr:aldehyde dehydrogenase family protein [Croceibacterium sp. D39]